jgi:HSP20 family protein
MQNRDLTPWTGGGRLTRYADDPFISFRRQVDRLFDDFLMPFNGGEPRSFAAIQGAVHPSIEVRDTEKAYEVAAELPGLEQKDLQLELKDNMLVISGEKRAEQKQEDGARRWSERTYGRFERAIPLDAEVQADKVDARFKNGVLHVTLPKDPRARDKSRRIEVKTQ